MTNEIINIHGVLKSAWINTSFGAKMIAIQIGYIGTEKFYIFQGEKMTLEVAEMAFETVVKKHAK